MFYTARENIVVYQDPASTEYNDSSQHFGHTPNLEEVNCQKILYKLDLSAREVEEELWLLVTTLKIGLNIKHAVLNRTTRTKNASEGWHNRLKVLIMSKKHIST